jgi:hypothetical protein
VGILADINPPESVEECFEKGRTTGGYVDARNYVEWLAELGIVQRDISVPSWTLEPVQQGMETTTASSHHPGSAAKVHSSLVLLLLLMKLALF